MRRAQALVHHIELPERLAAQSETGETDVDFLRAIRAQHFHVGVAPHEIDGCERTAVDRLSHLVQDAELFAEEFRIEDRFVVFVRQRNVEVIHFERRFMGSACSGATG